MAEQKQKSADECRRDYEKLARDCSNFDPETKKQLREHEAKVKEWLNGRKAAREKLLSQKLAASIALDAAIKRKATEDAAKETEKKEPMKPVIITAAAKVEPPKAQ